MNDNKGFSLVEMSIVLLIIGLLVVIVSSVVNVSNSAKVKTELLKITEVSSGIHLFTERYGRLPGDGIEENNKSIISLDENKDTFDELITSGILTKDAFLLSDKTFATSYLIRPIRCIFLKDSVVEVEHTNVNNNTEILGNVCLTISTDIDMDTTSPSYETGYSISIPANYEKFFDDNNFTTGQGRSTSESRTIINSMLKHDTTDVISGGYLVLTTK